MESTMSAIKDPIPNYRQDLFAFKGATKTPWISEYTQAFSSPDEWQGRIHNGTLVHTFGNTCMAHTTHHTEGRPKFPPGTIHAGLHTTARYLVSADPAVEELQQVCYNIAPKLEELMATCGAYHLHSPDGWITTAGFMTASKKAGLELSRAEFLALERAVPKDTLGRINYLKVQQLVQSVTATEQ